MAEILPIRRKTPSNQSINQSTKRLYGNPVIWTLPSYLIVLVVVLKAMLSLMKIDYLSVSRLWYQEFIIQKVNLLIEKYVE